MTKIFINPIKLFFALLILLVQVFTSAGCKEQAHQVKGEQYPFEAPSDTVLNTYKQNELLGRGLNMGNALEAPNEGEWGVVIKDEYFIIIEKAGFNSVRIPVRWSAHTLADSPFTIEASFFERVDWVTKQALDNGLAVIVNMHHYTDIMVNPEKHKNRLLTMWKQIAEHYRLYPDRFFLEILNEPNDKLTAELWNDYLAEALKIIRQSNQNRTLLIGTAEWGGVGALNKLLIPQDEQNVIVTFHYYNPFHFTHQGAKWVNGSDEWLGTTWSSTQDQKNAVISDFGSVLSWSKSHNRPVNMGEFGAYSKADINSRVAWTSYITSQAENFNWSWHYWEFCAGFGCYDPLKNEWRHELLQALIP